MPSPKIEQILKTLPSKPGVYLHKNVHGKVIYVGKAVNLKSRVRSYFHQSAQHNAKTRRLVEEIADIEFIVAESELEALLLENTLIKKNQPRFNVRLKDDKRYPYIKVHWQDPFPRVTTTRRLQNDGARYFGPYTAAWAAYQTLDLVRKMFPYLTCTRTIDGNDSRACLYYHIGRCAAPCIGVVNQAEYRAIIDQLCDFLNGNTEPVVADLRRQMDTAAENLDFERAAQIRDQIKAIDQIVEKQKVINASTIDEDVIAFAQAEGDACVQVFFIRNGKLVGRDYFVLEGSADENQAEIMTSFLKQFYDQATTIPPKILLPQDVDELMIIRDWLKSKRGADVVLKVPRRGKQRELLDMATQNAVETLNHLQAQWAVDETKQSDALAELQQALDLPDPPLRIECYDISTLQGTNTVGSMVVFAKGIPRKSDYRRFKIKSVVGQDDFASMQEMLRRRFKRFQDGGYTDPNQIKADSDNSWALLPDLIIIDGGKGQLNAALEVLDEFELRDAVPIVGLAKREEEIFLPGQSEPVILPPKSQGLFLVQRVRDEAHRFGVTYHRNLRGKGAIRSTLDDVDGIGPKRRKALLRQFGSLDGIRAATIEELAAVPGMTRRAAEDLKAQL
ncbi:MAG TPA: excinuclease ABC subunit UvrC [Anaerolineae bacterium]|nr:excinuclease ABC subunit UvrC [Anaerolineae bacterium]HRV91046.1 excinuclease ABC subunit UvrC [Anaerolineae bacterium]